MLSEISYVPLPRLADPSLTVPLSDDRAAPELYAAEPPVPPRAPFPDTASGAPRETGVPGAIYGPHPPASAPSLLDPGFSDPRLYGKGSALRPQAPRGLKDRFEASFGAAMGLARDSLADERRRESGSNQVRVLGRGITVFGDSANAYWRGFVVGNQRMTLPVDGREWEDLQMKKQRDDFVRDSILRARAAATRARVDAQRGSGDSP